MSLVQYKLLSEQEQVVIPKNRFSRLLFNSRIILKALFGYPCTTDLERQLIADNTTFFDDHIKIHSSYEDFGEFGEIYHLLIPKHDTKNFDRDNKDPVVVFIHGLGGNLHQFDEQYKYLFERFDIVGFDLPGSGNSRLHDPKYVLSLHNFTRFVLTFLERKGFLGRELVLVGHSYGTQVVLNLLKHLNAIQVKQVILLAPPKFPAVKTWGTSFVLNLFQKLPIVFEIFRIFDRINNIKSASLQRLFSTSRFGEIDDFSKFKQFKFNLQTNSQNFLNHIINWVPIQLDELITSVNHLKSNLNFKDILIIDGDEDKVTKNGGSTYKAVLGDVVNYMMISQAGHNFLLDSYTKLNKLIDDELRDL